MNPQHSAQLEPLSVDDLIIDPARRAVFRDGKQLSLPKLSYDLLLCLVNHAPGIVSTDHLLTEVWGDVVVSEETVKQRVSLLRQALGDDTRSPRYIESIRGIGYRLVATVGDTTPPAATAGRWKLPVLLLAVFAAMTLFFLAQDAEEAPGPASRSIAVLPFANLSPHSGYEYFGDGFHDELLNQLSKINALSVTSRTSVLPYRDASVSIPDIGRELNVEYVMEGSVRHTQNRVRILVQLIDTATDTHLWSEGYDRPIDLEGLFDIQIDVAEQVARAVQVSISSEEREQLQQLPTNSLRAYELFLLGRYHVWRANTADLQQSIDYFEQAIELDPDFAVARVGLARALTLAGTDYGWLPPREAFPAAEAQVLAALDSAPGMSAALDLRGDILAWYHWDWDAAEAAYKAALHIGSNPSLGYALFLSSRGRHDEAIAICEQVVRDNPRDQWALSNAAWRYLSAGQFRNAVDAASTAISIADNYGDARESRGLAYLQLGETDKAIADFERNVQVQGRSPASLAALSTGLARRGDTARIERLLSEVLAANNAGYVAAELIATVYLNLGNHEQALQWLEKAVRDRSRGVIFVAQNSRWDPLRDDERFVELMQPMQ